MSYAPESGPIEVLLQRSARGLGEGGWWAVPVKVACDENGTVCCYCFVACSSKQKRGSQSPLIVGIVIEVGVQDRKCLIGGGRGNGEPCNGADTERTSTGELGGLERCISVPEMR